MNKMKQNKTTFSVQCTINTSSRAFLKLNGKKKVTVTISRIPFSKVSSDVIGWMTVWANKIAKAKIQVKAGIT